MPNTADPFEHGRSQPRVGIFWAIETSDGRAHLLSAGVALDEATPYGACLTFEPGHADVWEAWRREASRDRARSILVRVDDYDEWPRGRIVYDTDRRTFVIYADRRLLRTTLMTLVRERFDLTSESVEERTDPHYQSRFSPTFAGANWVLASIP